jgi:hypothetical protein
MRARLAIAPVAVLSLVVLVTPRLATADEPTPSPTPSTTTDCGQAQGSTPAPIRPGVVCVAGGLNPGAGTQVPSAVPPAAVPGRAHFTG